MIIELKSEGLTLEMRDNSGAENRHIIHEIFGQKCYTKHRDIEEGDLVMDIGANMGLFSLYASKRGAERIYAFEPLEDNMALLQRNCEVNGVKNVVPVMAAVGAKKRRVTMHQYPESSCGLAHEVRPSASRVNVQMVALQAWINTSLKSGRAIDFMKVDIEGGEAELVYRVPASVWTRVNYLAMEYHANVLALEGISLEELEARLRELFPHVTVEPSPTNFGMIYAWR